MDKLSCVAMVMKAVQDACKRGVSLVPGIVAAQALVATDYGKHPLFREANNPLGILADSSDPDTLMIRTKTFSRAGIWEWADVYYRKYCNLADCFFDYGELLQKKLGPLPTQPNDFLKKTVPGLPEAEKKAILAVAKKWRLL